MGELKKETFVCIDCESTGLDAHNDRIIEIAAIRFTLDDILHEFQSLVNPQCLIPEASIAIHNITAEMVMNQPTIDKILPELLNMVGDHIIIGHGIHFDIALVTNAAKRAGIECTLHNNRTLDTLRLARSYGESPVNSLEQLRKHFNIKPEGAHRAMSDVLVNMEVFKYLIKKYHKTEQLFEILAKPIQFKIMPLGKHKGRALSEIPMNYLLWAGHQDFDQDLLFSIRSEIKRRKQGNLFNQATNPFSAL